MKQPITFSGTEKWPVAIASLALLLALAWPAAQNRAEQPTDDFPLSYYPMFSQERDTVYSLHYIVGYDSLRRRYPIPYHLIGTGGFNQVRRQINRQAKNDQGGVLLEKVAACIASRKSAPYCHLVALELVKGYYHLDNYIAPEGKQPLREKIVAQQNIQRP